MIVGVLIGLDCVSGNVDNFFSQESSKLDKRVAVITTQNVPEFFIYEMQGGWAHTFYVWLNWDRQPALLSLVSANIRMDQAQG